MSANIASDRQRSLFKRNGLTPLIAMLMMAVGCSSSRNQVWADYDIDAVPRMSEYRTFAWLPADEEAESGGMSEIEVQRLEKVVEAAFIERGYVLSTVSSADFLIGYYAGIERGVETSRGGAGYGIGFGGSGGSVGFGFGGGSPSRVYTEQTLVIDIVDVDAELLVWRGTAQRDLKPAQPPEERQKVLESVVSSILKRFPPKEK